MSLAPEQLHLEKDRLHSRDVEGSGPRWLGPLQAPRSPGWCSDPENGVPTRLTAEGGTGAAPSPHFSPNSIYINNRKGPISSQQAEAGVGCQDVFSKTVFCHRKCDFIRKAFSEKVSFLELCKSAGERYTKILCFKPRQKIGNLITLSCLSHSFLFFQNCPVFSH